MLQSFLENHLNGHYRYWGEISRNKAKHDLHRSRLEGKREWFCHCSTRRWNQRWADNMRRFQKCDVFRSSLKIARNWAVEGFRSSLKITRNWACVSATSLRICDLAPIKSAIDMWKSQRLLIGQCEHGVDSERDSRTRIL